MFDNNCLHYFTDTDKLKKIYSYVDIFCILSVVQIKISIVKQHQFYSLTAKDNGTQTTAKLKQGMGLDNMKTVAESFKGNFSYGYQDGFFIHMTLYVTED